MEKDTHVSIHLKECTEVPVRSWRGTFRKILDTLKDVGSQIHNYPFILIIPLAAFGLMVGLGLWGVISASNASADTSKVNARASATEAATSFEFQLEQTFVPAVTLQLMIEDNPAWAYWDSNFTKIAAQLFEMTANGSLYNIQLQPFGQVRNIYPLRPSDRDQYGMDLLLNPLRRPMCLASISSHQQGMTVGYFPPPSNITVVIIRQPIYVLKTSVNETFGYFYNGDNYTTPQFPSNISYPPILPTGWPSGYAHNCTYCYNASTLTQPSSRWWGFVTLTINLQAVTNGEDSRLVDLVNRGYKYALQSPLNSSNPNQYTTIASSGGINMNNAVFVNVYIPEQVGQNWQLWVEPVAGWYPSWTAPLIAAVIILSAVISGLLFVAMLYHVRQGSLLRETTAANQELARTTAILEEEKIRMDALLARQYDLLSCLDSKHPSVITAKKVLTLEHIDEVRRLVNDASRHGNMEAKDPIEVQELLGEGAFGKVYKGLWRGTEVAIKTIVLPSNMAGSEKREKMAVMEAAISSSLVHPNIVTTYTYSIRPHLDSMSTHASLMEGFGDLIECTPLESAIAKGGQGSVATHVSSLDSSMQTSIHSYEVRLVIEYCDKGSLHEALSMGAFLQGCGLCVSAILETAADVARAMVHMHAADVIHSDLKARNIMLKSSGQDGRGFTAKVADFGMSSQINQTEGHVSSMFQGTLTHMAPEVLMQGHISKAGDVYAFGILMWELFAAADPYTDLPAALLGHAITQENRRPKFPPFAPRDYVLLAESCWAPDAADRPTFEEVHEELQAMLNNVPPTSVPLIIEPPKKKPRPSLSLTHWSPAHQKHKSKSVSLTIGDDAGAVGDVRPDHASSEEFKKSHRKVCSPAEQMLNMLDQIIKGEKVTKDAAILLRRSIVLAGKDLHRPLERSFQPWSQVEKSGGKYLKGAASVVKSNGSTFKSISHNKSFILVIKEEDEEDLKEEDEEEGVCSQHGVCSDNKHANGSPMNQQRSSEGDWSRQSSAEMSSHKLNYHRLVEPGDEVAAVLSKIDEWQFDSFELDRVSQGWPLSMLTFAIVQKHLSSTSSRIMIDMVRLASFLRRLEDGYLNHPYHNRVHGADVVRSMYCIMTRGAVLRTVWPAEEMDVALLVAVISAAMHDYQHKGFNNDFLIKSKDDLALIYNNIAPMENHHLASAFALLKEGPLNFLRLMMNPVAANFRKEVINAVLATDMHNHHSIISAFNIKFKPPPPDAQPPLSGLMCKNSCTFSDGNVLMWTLDDDARSLVMQMSLKCADLGAIAADYDIHALWVQRLQEEFHNQGDAEKALGIPVSPLMDRTCVIDALAAVQPQFFKDAALPLFKSFSSVFRDCDQLLINTENNLRRRLEVVV